MRDHSTRQSRATLDCTQCRDVHQRGPTRLGRQDCVRATEGQAFQAEVSADHCPLALDPQGRRFACASKAANIVILRDLQSGDEHRLQFLRPGTCRAGKKGAYLVVPICVSLDVLLEKVSYILIY